MLKLRIATQVLGIAAASAFSIAAQAVDITGAGATFPYPVYAKWADAYRKATGEIGRAHV